MTVTLRKPTYDDAERMTFIENVCFGVNAWSRESIDDFITNEYSHAVVAVDEVGDIVGYAGALIICGDADVTNVAVMPEDRRCGIARLMMEELILICLQNGTETVFLEVREGNVPARALYEKMGFSAVGKRRGYYTSPREDAVIMAKILKLQ